MVPSSGNRDLEVRQQFEQERLELVVGAVDLVDQQHRRRGAADRGQQRPFQQVFFRKDLVLDGVGLVAAMRLDRQQLALVIPFIQRRRLIEPLIALQPDQFGAVHAGQRFCDLGLADARLAFQQQRTLAAIASATPRSQARRRRYSRRRPGLARSRRGFSWGTRSPDERSDIRENHGPAYRCAHAGYKFHANTPRFFAARQLRQ